MTGFASLSGSAGDQDWTWDIKAVNGRGLDLRLRLPDRITGLEAETRKRAGATLARGNVTINLRIASGAEAGRPSLNRDALDAAILTLKEIETVAMRDGLDLQPVRASDIAGMRGVMDATGEDADPATLKAELLRAFDEVLSAFDVSRAAEGAALAKVLSEQLIRVNDLTDAARKVAETRPESQRQAMKSALDRVLEDTQGIDPARLTQELALLGIKSDVTEEFDRLDTHVAAARSLLEKGGPIGRKLDFLMQEFNREANTLCSKAQSSELTAIGLDLKAVIDQMREQVQNIE